ncbi:alpha/beta hydrolase family protein [Nocardia rhamnosiphila]|uniref:Alpha/beta fold hydrolase n=1 Tax=Nocardia rhamnosiphila TaxID=426716 RepID=A0ABV2WXQ6_9NOCA
MREEAMDTDSVTHRRHRIPVSGGELDAVAVGPKAGTERWVLLVHGGPGGDKNGPANLYKELSAQLATEGIGSLRFDIRGAGESTGRYRDMTIARQVEDLSAARTFLASAYAPSSIGIVGESFGATTALAGLHNTEQALVLLWPAIWLLDDVFNSYVDEMSLTEARSQGFIVRDDEEIGLAFLSELLEMRDVSSALAGLQIPVLLIHGDEDTEVPVAQSVRGEQLVAGPVRRVIVPGGDHCLEKPSERVIVYQETVEWLTTHL